MNKVDQRAEPAPHPGPWRTCCQETKWLETLAMPLPAPGWVEGALDEGTREWGEEEGLHLWSQYQEIQVA